MQISSVHAEFNGEFIGKNCQIFSLGKKSYEQKRRCR